MTREEAINKVRQMSLPKETMEILQALAPELRESEDERIRKFLVKHVSEWIGCIEHDLKISSKDVESEEELAMFKAGLAYLEKQKEQKPVHTAKEMWKEMRLEVYAQASGNRHEPNYSDDSTKMFSLCDIDEILEKIGNSTVGSQPAEWSEADERILKGIIGKIDHDQTYGVSKLEMLSFLISLRPSWKPSEEQMEALYTAAREAPTIKENGNYLYDLYNDLKKLKV